MNITFDKNTAALTIKLTGTALIDNVEAAKQELLDALRQEQAVDFFIDLEDVTDIDISFLQLLVAFEKECADGGKTCKILNADKSPACVTRLKRYGMFNRTNCNTADHCCIFNDKTSPEANKRDALQEEQNVG